MLVKEIFDLGLKLAMEADPRGKDGVKKYLSGIKKRYDKLNKDERVYFEKELLINPYPDSFIHIDDGKTKVKRVLAGIDINSGDILLASQLNERGQKVDLVIAHHPAGRSLTHLDDVMRMNASVYELAGVPVHIAEKITEERIKEVRNHVHPRNHFQVIDVARLLKINFLNTHTFADNLVNRFIVDYLAKKKPDTLQDILDLLLELPEYREAKIFGSGPRITSGNPNHHVGKTLVEMTGGTTPSSRVYQELSNYGISTIVGMHMEDDSLKKAGEHHMNVVMAGHISSDSFGMNLFLDELEKRGIEVIPCGGLIRVSRNKKK